MKTKTTIIRSDMPTAEFLYPEEARQQKECIGLLKRTVDTFVEANLPDRNVVQSYSTILSSLTTMAVALALHMEIEKEDLLKLMTTAVEGNYERAKH